MPKEQKVVIAPEARPCDVCGGGPTHRLVNGVRTCLTCFEAEQAPEQPPEAPAPKTKPEVIPAGTFWCSKCHSLHRTESKIGKRHLKYQEA